MKKWSFLFAALFISALLFQSCKKDRNDKPCNNNSNNSSNNNNNNNNKQTNSVIDDQTFVNRTLSYRQFGNSAGKLAAEKAQSQAVKDFGTRMQTDHTQANSELSTLAKPKGLLIPTDLLAQEKADLDILNTATGRQFDEEFARIMVESHQRAISFFENAAQTQGGVSDASFRSWATAELPTLRTHLEKAKTLQNQVNQNKQ